MGKLPGVSFLRKNTQAIALGHANQYLVTPLRHFSWYFPFPLFMRMQYGFVQAFKTIKMKRRAILVQKHPLNSPVNYIGAFSDCRSFCSFAISLFSSVYLCSMASLFLYKCCHLDMVLPGCSHCKHVHWVARNCWFSFLNHRLDSTREQTTCFCSLNMYVVKYVMLFISCK